MDKTIQMNNETQTKKPFDPTTGPALKIVPCQNGWSLIQSSSQYDGPNTCCIVYPSYVFNSPAELAKAVANLVQFGTIERPPDKVEVPEGLRLVAEFQLPTQEQLRGSYFSCWYVFVTPEGPVNRFVDHRGMSSGVNEAHSTGIDIFQWIHSIGATHFRPLGMGELGFLK